MSFESTPAAASAASAPASSRSVMKSLYFDTTTAKRNPAAVGVPSIIRTQVSLVSLAALEFRPAFLKKGSCSFAHVFRRCDEAKERRLEGTSLSERHLEALVDRVDDVPHRNGGVPCERAGELQRFSHQIRGGNDAVDESDALRLGRRDLLPGQHELHRLAFAHQPRQPL